MDKAFVMLALLPLCGTVQSCNTPMGPPTGTYKVDKVRFVQTEPTSDANGPAPGVWIDTNMRLSSLSGGTLKSHLPYALALDYTDNSARFKEAEITSVTITYDDATVEAAAKQLKLPLRIAARQSESVNSVSGGRIVKSTAWIISGKLRDIVTRTKPFTLQMKGHFTKHDGSKLPFAIDEHFDVEIENTTKSAAEVLQDK